MLLWKIHGSLPFVTTAFATILAKEGHNQSWESAALSLLGRATGELEHGSYQS